MKLLKFTLIIIAIIAVIIVSVLAYAGFFTSIKIVEKETGGYYVAGKDFTGAYMNVGPTMDFVDSSLRAQGIVCTKGFGIYYDNPNEVPQEQCRSFVGNIIETIDSTSLAKISALGLRIDSVPKKQSMVIDFPTKNSMSYMIGPMKAYPAFTKYIAEKKYTPTLSIEVYDVPAKMTYYIMQY